MKNLNKISKTLLYLVSIFFILWFGSYVTRNILVFQLFEPDDLSLKTIYSSQNLFSLFYSMIGILILNIVSYFGFFLFFVSFLVVSKINLKNEGWLLISTLIIFLTSPLEIFLLTFDFRIVQKLFSLTFSNYEILVLLKKRMTLLGSFSLTEIFAYFFVIFLVLFRPFRVKRNEN